MSSAGPSVYLSTGSGSPSGGSGMAHVIEASGLVKRYGAVTALDGLDLAVPQGTVLGLLGPNGAGKTTAVRVLTTLLVPDGGTARVAGLDVRTDPRGVRRQIGLSGQYAAVDEYLTGFENLDMIGRLYHLGRRRSRERTRELLEQFRLADAADRPVKTYSGGMRRRLDLAGAIVARPPVLFLDEPTTGLDPRSRNDMWDVIRELVGSGTTLLLTTQYLEEADRLADCIVVIDAGRAIAQGTTNQLKSQVGGERVEVSSSEGRRAARPRRPRAARHGRGAGRRAGAPGDRARAGRGAGAPRGPAPPGRRGRRHPRRRVAPPHARRRVPRADRPRVGRRRPPRLPRPHP